MAQASGNEKKPNKRPGYYTEYYMLRYPVNKLKRILRRDGLEAAREWARAKGKLPILQKLLAQGVKVRRVIAA